MNMATPNPVIAKCRKVIDSSITPQHLENAIRYIKQANKSGNIDLVTRQKLFNRVQKRVDNMYMTIAKLEARNAVRS